MALQGDIEVLRQQLMRTEHERNSAWGERDQLQQRLDVANMELGKVTHERDQLQEKLKMLQEKAEQGGAGRGQVNDPEDAAWAEKMFRELEQRCTQYMNSAQKDETREHRDGRA
ncbi:hypothetical protein BDZ91DRAFT_794143 [Kalaharituber pfeilii]|nr:hypothetical protein BDZ91DRAFT_794143 [Kalaharituber pfeilii]